MQATAVLSDLSHSAEQRRRPKNHQGLLTAPTIRNPLTVFAAVLASALCGILLQPHGMLSSFWPANAVLLGLMLRAPQHASPAGWAAAIAGFMLADIAMGSDFGRAALLTFGNLSGVAVCFILFRRLAPGELRLRTAFAALYLLLIVLAGSAVAGLAGMIINPTLFRRSVSEGFLFWSVSEFTNYLAVLPVVLTAPVPVRRWLSPFSLRIDVRKLLPALACVLGLALAPIAAGPSAVVFPVPGLIWCALVYDVATVAAMAAAIAGWMLIAPSMHWISLGIPLDTFPDLLNFRSGIAVILLGPISVAGVMAARSQSMREAAAAREAAERALASRALLLATMTHELRSPLNIITGFATLLEQPAKSTTTDEQAEYGQIIHEAARHMNALVTDLLDTAKVQAGQTKFSPKPTDSHDMLVQSTRLVKGMALERRIDIVVETGFWPEVNVDPRAIKQVMINLLANAVKFSPDGSRITISGEMRQGRLAVSVVDRGCGISAADLERIGRPYAQAGDDASQRQGTGLGLTLSMRLIAQHGGVLRLTSEPGKGTTATFDLPLPEGLAANDV